ncbi:MAG: hypothetical protein FWD31_12475 [Planctomycetaceae bacterium]|nr:hypothetical protein [Planctomycetaceae bacterium]
MTNKQRHQIIGIAALFCLGIYFFVLCSGHAGWQHTGESILRLTVLLGVVWLAWNDLIRLPRWAYVFAPIIILAVVVFPKVAPIVIVILVPLWLFLKFLKFILQPLPPQHRGPKAK